MKSLVDIVGVMHDPRIAEQILDSLADARNGFNSAFLLYTDNDYSMITIGDRSVGENNSDIDKAPGEGIHAPAEKYYVMAFVFKPADMPLPHHADNFDFNNLRRMQYYNAQVAISNNYQMPEDSRYYIPSDRDVRIPFCNPVMLIASPGFRRTADILLLQRTVYIQKDKGSIIDALGEQDIRPVNDYWGGYAIDRWMINYKDHFEAAQAIRGTLRYMAVAGVIQGGRLIFENVPIQTHMETLRQLDLKEWYGVDGKRRVNLESPGGPFSEIML